MSIYMKQTVFYLAVFLLSFFIVNECIEQTYNQTNAEVSYE